MKPEELLSHGDFVRSLARRLVWDHDAAADISQETWLAALEHPPASHKPMRAWLRVVVRNLSSKFRRGERRRLERERIAAEREAVIPTEEVVAREEIRRRVVEEVLGLKEPYRSTILFKYYEGLSTEAVARRFNVPESTVRVRLMRGLEQLRYKLDAAHAGDRKTWCLALAPLAGLTLKAKALAAGAAVGTASISNLPLLGATVMAGKVKILLAAAFLFSVAGVILFVMDNESDESKRIMDSNEAAYLSQPMPEDPGSSSGETAVSMAAADPEASWSREAILPDHGKMISVQGRVVGEGGNLLEGVRVRKGLWTWDWPSALDNLRRRSVDWTDEETLTDGNGSFSMEVPEHLIPFTFLDLLKEGYNLLEPLALAEATHQKEDRLFLDEIVLPKILLIRGKVVDEQGAPMKACRVGPGTMPWENRSDLNVRTDDQGYFELPIRWENCVYISAYLENYGWSLTKKLIKPGSGDNVPFVTVILESCQAISGKVFDGNGSPAEGLELYAYARLRGTEYQMHLKARTDEEGAFRFFPAPEADYMILAEVPGYSFLHDQYRFQKLMISEKVWPGDEGLSLHLPHLASLVLDLTDRNGNPIVEEPGSISFRRCKEDPEYDGEYYSSDNSWDWRGPATHLGPGLFGYPRIRRGLYDLWIWHEDYLSQTVEKVEIPDAMKEVRVQVKMETMQLIRGKVYHPDGSPAQGVKILCERSTPYPSHPKWPEATFTHYGLRRRQERMDEKVLATDASGAFEFRLSVYFDNPRNIYHLYSVVKDREIPMGPPIELSIDHPQEEVEFVLPDPHITIGGIEGTIRDSKGRPLANALVVAWNGDDFFCRVRSNDAGFYSFKGLDNGKYIVDGRALTAASLRDHGSGISKGLRKGAEILDKINPFNAVVSNGKTAHLDLTVQDPWNGAIHGRILGRGNPLPTRIEFKLLCLKEDGRQKEYDSQSERPTAGDLFAWNWKRHTRKDMDPRSEWFRFQDLKAGRYGVGVILWGHDGFDRYFNMRAVGAVELDLEASETREAYINVDLASIRVEVRRKGTGEPISHAWIFLNREENRWHEYHGPGISHKTDEQGVFFDELVPAEKYYITVMHDQYATAKKRGFELAAGDRLEGATIDLEPPCTLKGTIKVSVIPGEKVPHRTVKVAPAAWEGLYKWADMEEDGSFMLDHLPAGPAKLTVKCRGKETITRTVELPQQEGEALIIEFF